MQYKIVVDKRKKNDPTNRVTDQPSNRVTHKIEYTITEEFDYIKIETNHNTTISLKGFLLDLDSCDAPYIINIKEEGEN